MGERGRGEGGGRIVKSRDDADGPSESRSMAPLWLCFAARHVT